MADFTAGPGDFGGKFAGDRASGSLRPKLSLAGRSVDEAACGFGHGTRGPSGRRTHMYHLNIRHLARTAGLLAVAAALTACSTVGAAKKPAAAAPVPRTETVPVVATAYGASAKCNSIWAGKNAIGGRLKSGEVTSAAADWSRFPVGTKFRVKETGRVYVVDDYGSAMVGKDKVDLFKTNYRDVYRWGVRSVNLEIIEWGSFEKSLTILKPRSRSRHVKTMVQSLEAKLRTGGTPQAG